MATGSRANGPEGRGRKGASQPGSSASRGSWSSLQARTRGGSWSRRSRAMSSSAPGTTAPSRGLLALDGGGADPSATGAHDTPCGPLDVQQPSADRAAQIDARSFGGPRGPRIGNGDAILYVHSCQPTPPLGGGQGLASHHIPRRRPFLMYTATETRARSPENEPSTAGAPKVRTRGPAMRLPRGIPPRKARP